MSISCGRACLMEVVSKFELKIGNKPKDILQLFNFCKQESIELKYSEIKIWWIKNYNAENTQKNVKLKQKKYKKLNQRKKCKNRLLYPKTSFLHILKKEIESYKLILSTYNNYNIDNINNSIVKYQSFLTDLYSLKHTQNKIFTYLDSCVLSSDIQLLWRIHLIHPILYKQNCQTFCGLLLNPKYNQINFTNIPDIRNKNTKRKKVKPSILVKRVFSSIDFKSEINLYLFFIKQIVEMVENEIINLNNSEIINEYQQFFQIFEKSQSFFSDNYDKIIRLIPTLKQSFLYFTHCLFPQIFHNEIHIKTYPFQKYFNLNFMMIHIENQYKINSIWNVIKNTNINDKNKENIVNKMYLQIKIEYLLFGFFKPEINQNKISMDIISVLSKFCDDCCIHLLQETKLIAARDQCSGDSKLAHFYKRNGVKVYYTSQATLSMYGNVYGV